MTTAQPEPVPYFAAPVGVESFRVMLQEARAHLGGELFTADAVFALLDVLEHGASSLVIDEVELSSELLEKVASSTRDLLNVIVDDRNAFGFEAFGAEQVYEARLRLCPGFWPFC